MAPALEITGLHAWYGESHVLHGVDLVVRQGEVVTILGRNGAGRTTTMRAILGLTTARKGSVKIAGVESIGMPTHRIAHLGIGYCPEERGIFASLSCEENLVLPPPLRGASDRMTVKEIYSMFPNLAERRTSQGTRLSGGEQQMLAVARILRTGARLLLLDEISEGLAPVKVVGVVDLSSDLTMYYVVLFVVVAAITGIVRTVHSPFGQVLKGIKENEPRAVSLGYDVDRFKLLAFILSAGLSGLAGSLKTLVVGFATLSDVHWSTSGSVILMTLVGGLETFSGPLVGAAVVVLLEDKISDLGYFLERLTKVEWFGSLGECVSMVTGLVFIVCVLVLRRGIMGEVVAVAERTKSGLASRRSSSRVSVVSR